MTDTLLRRKEVERRTGFGRSTIYDWMGKGMFPEPVRIGPSCRWLESDVQSWIDKHKSVSQAA